MAQPRQRLAGDALLQGSLSTRCGTYVRRRECTIALASTISLPMSRMAVGPEMEWHTVGPLRPWNERGRSLATGAARRDALGAATARPTGSAWHVVSTHNDKRHGREVRWASNLDAQTGRNARVRYVRATHFMCRL
jgi:hypothetical protein